MRRGSREEKTATSKRSVESLALGDSRTSGALLTCVLIAAITGCGVEPLTPGIAGMNPAPVVSCPECTTYAPLWWQQQAITAGIGRIKNYGVYNYASGSVSCESLKEAANME